VFTHKALAKVFHGKLLAAVTGAGRRTRAAAELSKKKK